MGNGITPLPLMFYYSNWITRKIEVPHGHLPVIGHFNVYSDNGTFSVNYEETPFKKDVLCPFEPETTEKCIVMIQIHLLNEFLKVEIKTGEGWKWNPETLEYDFCESPDCDHKWNPFSKTWEKVCDICSELLHRTKDYNLLDYMTDDDLFRVNAEVPFCECDRCPRCMRFQYIDPYGHDACESRD